MPSKPSKPCSKSNASMKLFGSPIPSSRPCWPTKRHIPWHNYFERFLISPRSAQGFTCSPLMFHSSPIVKVHFQVDAEQRWQGPALSYEPQSLQAIEQGVAVQQDFGGIRKYRCSPGILLLPIAVEMTPPPTLTRHSESESGPPSLNWGIGMRSGISNCQWKNQQQGGVVCRLSTRPLSVPHFRSRPIRRWLRTSLDFKALSEAQVASCGSAMICISKLED